MIRNDRGLTEWVCRENWFGQPDLIAQISEIGANYDGHRTLTFYFINNENKRVIGRKEIDCRNISSKMVLFNRNYLKSVANLLAKNEGV